MATKISRTSDLSGEDNATVVRFGFDDSLYEIDLTTDEVAQFTELLSTYIDKARNVGTMTNDIPLPDNVTPAEVRRWARANGYPSIGDRGKLSEGAKRAYLDAHQQ